MKTWVKVLLGVVAVGLIAVIAAVTALFYLTGGMTDTANGFFAAVKHNDFNEARNYLAEDFKANTSENSLKEFIAKSAISNFKEASWSNRQISTGGKGELEGSITTETGGVVPIKLTFVKENDTWKIFSLEKPPAGVQTAGLKPSPPQAADAIALVKKTMHNFIVSLEQKNMEHFRETSSQPLKNEFTTEQLNQAYKQIIESGTNLSVLENMEPVLSSDATIGEDGVLLLTGYYPTEPSKVHFKQKYIYEGVSWKPSGLSISIK
jgi:hypothetical protein